MAEVAAAEAAEAAAAAEAVTAAAAGPRRLHPQFSSAERPDV